MNIFSTLVFLVLASNCLAFQSHSIFNISPDLLENAKAVVHEDHYNFEIINQTRAIERRRKAVTLISEIEVEQYFRIYYDKKSEIKSIKIELFDSGGKMIRSYKKKDTEDIAAISRSSIFEDNRVKTADLSYSDYPYTIVFEYEKIWDEFISCPAWYPQQYNTSVQNGSYTVKTPKEIGLNYNFFNEEIEVAKNEGDENLVLQWKVSNLKAIKKEAFCPPINKVIPHLLVVPKHFRLGSYSGSYESWEAFSSFQYELNKGRDKLTPEMKIIVSNLIKDCKSNTEKISALYKYLQKNTRYVSVQLGIGGWQTFDAAYVEKNKFGDCKALTNFMKAMLKEAGLISYPTLINSGYNKYQVEEDFVGPMFNHVILYIPEEDIWLECTASSAPIDYLGDSNSNKSCLLIKESDGELIQTKRQQEDHNKRKYTIDLKGNGSAEIKVNTIHKGIYQEYLRALILAGTKDKIEEYYIDDLNISGFDLDDLEYFISKEEPIIRSSFNLKVKSYASQTGKRIFLPINLINNSRYHLKKADNRIQDVYFKTAETLIDTFEINIPGRVKIESQPEEYFELKNEFGEYELKIQKRANGFTIVRIFKLRKDTYPNTKYEELRSFFKEIRKRDKQKIVLVNVA